MTLTEKRKSDRKEMTRQVLDLCARHETKATLRDPELCGPRETGVNIQCDGGLRLTVDFDGMSWQHDTFVCSWYMTTDSKAKLQPHAFGFDSVNPHHFRKATSVAYGFDALMAILTHGLTITRDGSAYQD